MRAVLAGASYVAGFAVASPLAHAALGAGLQRLVPAPGLDPVVRLAGAAVAPLGLLVVLAATLELRFTGHGLPVSSSPPRRLVTRRAYALSRHPIYLGAVLLFSGAALAAGSFWTAVVGGTLLSTFFLCYACGVEEPVLLRRFGAGYEAYRERTPLLVGLPLRRTATGLLARLLATLSVLVNAPRIARWDPHVLFWGYGVWPAAGVGFGLAVTESLLRAGGLGTGRAAWCVTVLTGAGLLGTRLTWRVLTALGRGRPFRETGGSVGFVSWGAALGVLFAAAVLGLLRIGPTLLVLDAALPGLLVAQAFGRIGCLFYGCCYGKEAAGPLSLRYVHPALKAVREGRVDPSALLPVQLFSSAWGAAGAILVLCAVAVAPLPPGAPAALTASLYGFCRFDEEWLRTGPPGALGPVSPPQLAALAVAVSGLCGLLLVPAGPSLPRQAFGLASAVPAAPPPTTIAVLFGSALLTFLVFSYHHGEVGRWS